MKKSMITLLATGIFFILAGVAYVDDLKLNFRATLTGAQEVPQRESPAHGDIKVVFDRGFTKLDVDLRITRNTVGTITRAHFHCAKPGENGPIVFGLFDPGPFPVSDRVNGALTNADYTGANCVPTTGKVINNLASLAFAMREGLIYANVHTSVFSGGELRGQMIETE